MDAEQNCETNLQNCNVGRNRLERSPAAGRVEVVPLARVVSGNRNVAEQTESHRAIADRVMAGRSHSAETARIDAVHREIDSGEYAASASSRGVPGATALYRVGIESSPTLLGKHANRGHIRGIVGQLQLLSGRVSAFEVFNLMKETWIFPEGPMRTQAASKGPRPVDSTKLATPMPI